MTRNLATLPLLLMAIVSTQALAQGPEQGSVVRLDAAVDAIVAPGARLEQLADMPGQFTREGPTWVRDGGYLIYTVRNGNRRPGSPPPTDSDIIKWDPRTGQVSPLVPGVKVDGNTLDRQGRIVSAINIGEGRIQRLEKNGERSVLAREYDGKPINPNDLVYKSDGTLYFSSPPRWQNATDIPSLFMLRNDQLQLLSPTAAATVEHPNGLALSADEKHLYVTNNPKLMKFDVLPDNTIANGRVFLDMKALEPLQNIPDGVKVDTQGNVYVTGPHGVWILSPEGKHLGTIVELNRPANLAFGGDDGKTLFITSRPGLHRIQLKVAGPLP